MMKTLRLLIATVLSLVALAGVIGALAWNPPTVARASHTVEAPAAPLTLPPPYLSDADAADAPYGPSPRVDGRIAPGEYAIAHRLAFPTYGGNLEVFIRQDAITLYLAFDSADTTPYPFNSGGGTGPAFQVFLDTRHDRSTLPQTDDYKLNIDKGGNQWENRGDGSGWGGAPTGNWTAVTSATSWGWQGEFAISLAKLGITQTGPISIGLALAEVWTPSWPKDWYWPSTGFYLAPSTWGHLASSSEWGAFYWKPGPWQDYAPSGMPDFDQRQWSPTYCGPYAAANSLWWFDSKFEPRPVGSTGGPPGTIPISDSYTLVRSYAPSLWDDHDPRNVISLTMNLGQYFNTDLNPLGPGTNIYDMYNGLQRYLRDRGLWDDYIVTLVDKPEFTWIADEVMRSEDVVLLLGFWQEQPPGSGTWVRLSGHFVTVAGVNANAPTIALSDPAQDWAEITGIGRVLSGSLIVHSIPHTGVYTTHNDAGNVSHDIYPVLPGSPSPGGLWWLPTYEPPIDFLMGPPGMNPNPKWSGPPLPYVPGWPVHTEIEYALAVSPYAWKASGRWVQDAGVPLYGRRFVPYRDLVPSGVPDLDQKQDNWGQVGPIGWQWSFCGPVAAANSLWWFDSKFEHRGAVPPIITDTYPLLRAYGPWDDHDPQNVDNLLTPWPPPGWPLTPPPILPGQGEFVEDLALYFRTDQVGSGTVVTDVYNGLGQYLTLHGLRQGYVITQVQSPDFWWVAEETERSEDVILLLGFYASPAAGIYERVGGHFVTVPGVSKPGGSIAFSDPSWDRMETVLPPNEFVRVPKWSGRVASDGDPPLGPSGLVPTYTHVITHTGVYTLHNDAANVSHDAYRVIPTDSPGGTWGPSGYVSYTNEITNFVGMNGGGTYGGPGLPVQTEVEWAVAVSPVADLWVTKAVAPASVVPGDWITFTLVFSNAGNTAENVVISDVLPARLTNASYTYTLNYAGVLTSSDTFTWTAGTLRWNEGGIITITAQVDPSAGWPAESLITNTAEITTTTQEQYQVKPMPNTGSASFKVQAADLTLAKSAAPAMAVPGDPVTFTIVFSNTGAATAQNVVLTDALPAELGNLGWSYWTASGAAITARPGPTYVWDLPDLAPMDWGVITVTAKISSTLPWPPSITLTNVVTISTTTIESVPGLSNSTSATLTVQTADLGIVKSVTPTGTVSDGDWLTFTLVYSNAGPATASSVVITDLLSSNLLTGTASFTYTNSYGGLLVANDHYLWRAGQVPAGSWGIITVTAQVSNAQGAFFTNQALVGGWFDRDGSNNQSTITVPLPAADVWVAKTVAPALLSPGQWITFNIAFGNASYVAENVVISDALPAGLVNASYTYTLNYLGALVGRDSFTWTVGTLNKGQGGLIAVTAQVDPATNWPAVTTLTNTVEITTTSLEQVQTVPLPNSASVAFTVQTADLQIRKTVLPTRTLTTGDWLTFTLVYSNAGPAAATNVVITDLLSSRLLTATASFTFTTSYSGLLAASDHYVWQAGTVPAGGWGTITITAQISGVLGASSLANQALVAGWFDRDPSNNQFTITVPLSGSTVYLPIVMRN